MKNVKETEKTSAINQLIEIKNNKTINPITVDVHNTVCHFRAWGNTNGRKK
jgi:hypothetical protein